MNTKKKIAGLLLATAGALFAEERPNVILMMCDDLGWGDTGFNGNEIIQTPHLDRMADEGANLTHFYSVGPVCSPSRASFLTGRHYYRMGVWWANNGHLPQEEYTLARMAKQNGYTTGHFGKWHVGTLSRTISSKGKHRKPELNYAPPWERDYDESFVTESATCTWDPGIGDRAKNNPYYHNGVPVTEPPLGCDSRVIMDRTIPFIQKAVEDETPFVAVIWFHAPHEDVQAGPDYLKMYEGHGEAAHYYGCITAMDDQVGRLRAELSRLGIADNTALFFCSDNGPEGKEPKDRSKTRLSGSPGEFKGRKRDLYDGGVRVPALALWPGHVQPGSQIDVPMSLLDYLPTVGAMTGAPLLDGRVIDGESLVPVLEGKTRVHSKAIPFRARSEAGLVKGNFKLIINSFDPTGKTQLYDLSADKTESENLANKYPEKVQQMRAEISKFLASAKLSHSGAEYDAAGYEPVDKWDALHNAAPKPKKRKK